MLPSPPGRRVGDEGNERHEMTDDTLIADLTKAWRFLYRRGFIEGFESDSEE